MKKFLRNLVALLAALTAGAALAAEPDLTPASLWHGQTYHNSDREPSLGRIWNAEQWNAFFAAAMPNRPPPEAPDFKDATVLVVDGGACPTGGWSVEVVRAYREGKEWIVEFRRVPPAPDRMVTQAIAHPLAAVRFDKADLGRRPVLRDVTPRDSR
jgi:hypothetical protein